MIFLRGYYNEVGFNELRKIRFEKQETIEFRDLRKGILCTTGCVSYIRYLAHGNSKSDARGRERQK